MRIGIVIGIGALIFTSTVGSGAAAVGLESVGARFGFAVAEGSQDFHQAEIFTELRLPWRWDLWTTNWYVLPQGEISAGWIGDGYKNAFITTFGPRMVLGRERFPLTAFLGCNPTFMTREEFENRDFGIPFQFTSYVGIGCDIGKQFNLNCRYQHMSNGSLAEPNPGLNLLMFGLSYRF